MNHLDWLAIGACLAIAGRFPKLGERLIRPVEKAFSRLAAKRGRAVLFAFLVTIALRLALLPLIPVPVPGVHDEFSYLLQADTFAHGRLANPPHPMWVSFETMHVNWFPTYSSMYPPAQSFALAVGQVLGHPWIGVLLSCAGMVAAVVWMLQAWMPARWALLGGMITFLRLGITSYWMNSYWGGAVAAIGGAFVAGALGRILRRPKLKDALLLGMGVAILANSRPYEGLVFCLVPAVALLVWLWKKTEVRLRVKLRQVVAPVAGVLVLLGAFMLFYNRRLTGDPWLLPHVLNTRTYLPASPFVWGAPVQPRRYRNLQMTIFYDDWARSLYDRSWKALEAVSTEKIENYEAVYFWLGGFPLLCFVPFALFDRRMRYLTWTLIVSAAGLFIVIWSLPHYAAPVISVMYALLVQSLRHMRTLRFSGRMVGVGLSRATVFFLLVTTSICVNDRVRPPMWDWNGDMGIAARAKIEKELDEMPGKQLAIVRYGRDHNVHEEWVYNKADIDGSKVVWARELDPEQDRKLVEYFRDRKVWIISPENFPVEPAPYSPLRPGESPPPDDEER